MRGKAERKGAATERPRQVQRKHKRRMGQGRATTPKTVSTAILRPQTIDRRSDALDYLEGDFAACRAISAGRQAGMGQTSSARGRVQGKRRKGQANSAPGTQECQDVERRTFEMGAYR